ncbi:MAG: protein phosphatase 2C domain-containing protein [Thermoflexales bacterium]|nr:protein phosphatase 2C domain-containing protein [Thermoflexales bacterium]
MTTLNLLTMDALPVGEYVVEPHGRRFVITAILGRTPTGRTYRAQDARTGTPFYLHESLVPPGLSGVMSLANLAANTELPHVAPLLPPFGMPWFDGVVRYFVAERIPPDRMSEAETAAQSKKEWERWVEQLLVGLHELHRRGVAFGFDARTVALHIAISRSGVASWQLLGGLQLLHQVPEAEFTDVGALAAFAANTKLLEAPSHIRHTLQSAAQGMARLRAAELVERLIGNKVADTRSGTLRIELGAATSVGMREHNEDNFCAVEFPTDHCWSHPPVLIGVADGMGGVDAGEVASAVAIAQLQQRTRAHLATVKGAGDLNEWVNQVVREINAAVVEEGQRLGTPIGSTLAFALIVEGVAFYASVGDSRIYLWSAQRNNGAPMRLVRDHSLVQSMVDAGLLRDEERYHHPERNKLVRSLGDLRSGYSDEHPPLPLQPGDWLGICSDGLWEAVHDAQLAEVLAHAPNAQVACERLVDLANSNDAEDNITVVIARVY